MEAAAAGTAPPRHQKPLDTRLLCPPSSPQVCLRCLLSLSFPHTPSPVCLWAAFQFHQEDRHRGSGRHTLSSRRRGGCHNCSTKKISSQKKTSLIVPWTRTSLGKGKRWRSCLEWFIPRTTPHSGLRGNSNMGVCGWEVIALRIIWPGRWGSSYRSSVESWICGSSVVQPHLQSFFTPSFTHLFGAQNATHDCTDVARSIDVSCLRISPNKMRRFSNTPDEIHMDRSFLLCLSYCIFVADPFFFSFLLSSRNKFWLVEIV